MIIQINTQIRPWRKEEQKVDKEKKQYYTRKAVLQSLIPAWKRKGKKGKNQIITTRGPAAVQLSPTSVPPNLRD